MPRGADNVALIPVNFIGLVQVGNRAFPAGTYPTKHKLLGKSSQAVKLGGILRRRKTGYRGRMLHPGPWM